MMEGFVIRKATMADADTVYQFILELAEYERMEADVKATREDILQSVFIKNQAEVLLGEEDGVPVGFALYFMSYSTFLGRANLYLEDIFVRESCRGKGYGKAFFSALAKVARERGCGRMDWACLDWNEPSIAFYKGLGAKPMDDWTVYRLEGEALGNLAE